MHSLDPVLDRSAIFVRHPSRRLGGVTMTIIKSPEVSPKAAEALKLASASLEAAYRALGINTDPERELDDDTCTANSSS